MTNISSAQLPRKSLYVMSVNSVRSTKIIFQLGQGFHQNYSFKKVTNRGKIHGFLVNDKQLLKRCKTSLSGFL